MENQPEDSLPLASLETTDQIEGFRRKAHPLCRHCANDRLTIAAWERSTGDASEWIIDS